MIFLVWPVVLFLFIVATVYPASRIGVNLKIFLLASIGSLVNIVVSLSCTFCIYLGPLCQPKRRLII
jgi:hypothetical protein